MNRSSFLYYWLLNRIRSVAAIYGLFSSMCALLTTLLAIAVLLVISLIPLYLNKGTSAASGELYCINNYTFIVGFEIPQYNTSFGVTLTSGTYTITSSATFSPYTSQCTGPINLTTSESITITDTCSFGLLSVIYPAVPNAQVYENYALSEACYRTLQSCHYDSSLTACLLSSCTAVNSTNSTTNGSYPLTYYTLLCTANIYYKTRCPDAAASSGLYYSSANQNSACRQQRLNRINSCLNSSVQLSDVPCLISVSSGIVTTTTGTCSQTGTTNPFTITIADGAYSNSSTPTASSLSGSLTTAFSSPIFWASDQSTGHVYMVSSVNSETYASTQKGALYCGGVTSSEIATSISAALNSQTPG